MSSNAHETIRTMWSERASSTLRSEKVTHPDTHQRELEVAELSRYLLPSYVVLDIGCGNGWATVQLASRCHHITGVDYSDEMISRARAEHSHVKNCDWKVDNVLSLKESARYDAVVTVRCLINIVQRDLQWRAITNLQRAL